MLCPSCLSALKDALRASAYYAAISSGESVQAPSNIVPS